METKLSELPRLRLKLSNLIDRCPLPRGNFLTVSRGRRLSEVFDKINNLVATSLSEETHVAWLHDKSREMARELSVIKSWNNHDDYLPEKFVENLKNLHEEIEKIITVHMRPRRDGDLIYPWSILSREQQLSVHFSRAIESENIDTLTNLVVSEGVDPSASGLSGTSYLNMAIESNSAAVVTFLLENIADVDSSNADAVREEYNARLKECCEEHTHFKKTCECGLTFIMSPLPPFALKNVKNDCEP